MKHLGLIKTLVMLFPVVMAIIGLTVFFLRNFLLSL
jgi:hypothetical protein